jgi:general secretion pathway protein F
LAVFAYSGLDHHRTTVRGTVAADTPRQARDQLRDRGLLIHTLVEQSAVRSGQWLAGLTSGRLRRQWTPAVHDLAMLLHAGIPLLEALDTVCEQSKGKFRTALLQVRDRVSSGSSFAEALAERPDLFDPASIHLVEVGESSGTLENVLEQLSDFKQRMSQFQDRVFTALMYPAFLTVFGIAAAVYLMTGLMPPLLEHLEETTQTLPWPTVIVKACSDVLLNHGLWLSAVLILAVIATALVLRTEKGKRLWHRLLLRLPIIGPIALKQALSRIAVIIATLSRSGVVLTNAFDLAAKSTNNLVLRDALGQVQQRISAGDEIATALEQTDVFPPLAVRVFSVGQESGRLEEMLTRLSADYERQISTASARFTALLEPILILCLALFIGFIVMATFLPIMEAGNVY